MSHFYPTYSGKSGMVYVFEQALSVLTSTRCNYHGFLPDACIALRIAPPKTRLQQHYDT